MIQKPPTDGWARLIFVSGQATQFRPVTEIDADNDPYWVNCQGDTPGIACSRFARLYVAQIEHVTDEEKKAFDEKAKTKKKEA